MGTDVICLVETKDESGWTKSGEMDINRSYSLFAVIGGVRISSTFFHESNIALPYFPLRGLPDDSPNKDYFSYDTYNQSWITLEELNNDTLRKLHKEMIHNDIDEDQANYLIHRLIKIRFDMKKYKEEYKTDDVRIVFGFDC